jgi:hypothetical protein
MANMFLLRTATALAAVASARGQNAPANPEELVNIVGGTQSKEDFSYGNIMPDTTLPWGFNAWAAQTNLDRQWWFASWDRSFYGFRCTHQPSPWIGDYGVLRFSAAIIDKAHQGEKLFSAYDPTKSDWAPYYQNHTLLAWGSRDGYLTVELAPTEHGAVMRFSFPPYVAQTPGGLAPGWNQTRRVWVSLNGAAGAASADPGTGGKPANRTTTNETSLGCVSWRQTAGCDPSGQRQPANDKSCSTTIPVRPALSHHAHTAVRPSGSRRRKLSSGVSLVNRPAGGRVGVLRVHWRRRAREGRLPGSKGVQMRRGVRG